MGTDQKELSLEDAEVLLENKQYIRCERCESNRRRWASVLNASCPDCKAWGEVVNPRYVEACINAGLPVPLHPEQANIDRIDALMYAVDHRMRATGVKVDQFIVDDLMKQHDP